MPTLGDPATADPCSLLDRAALSAYGTPMLIYPYFYPEQCGVRLTGRVPGYVDATAQFGLVRQDLPPTGPSEPVGPFTVYRQPAQADRCDRTVRITGTDQVVYVEASEAKGTEADLCAVADKVVASTTAVLAGPGVGRHPADTTPGALTATNICDLGDGAGVDVVPGLDTGLRNPGYAGWRCTWGGDPAFTYSPMVDILVLQAPELTGRRIRIGSRSATVTPNLWPGLPQSCTVALAHRTITSRSGESLVEAAEITVYAGLQSTPTAACGYAQRIAGRLAGELPAT